LRSLRPLGRTVMRGHDVQPLWQCGDGSSAMGERGPCDAHQKFESTQLDDRLQSAQYTNPLPPQFVGHRDACAGGMRPAAQLRDHRTIIWFLGKIVVTAEPDRCCGCI